MTVQKQINKATSFPVFPALSFEMKEIIYVLIIRKVIHEEKGNVFLKDSHV